MPGWPPAQEIRDPRPLAPPPGGMERPTGPPVFQQGYAGAGPTFGHYHGNATRPRLRLAGVGSRFGALFVDGIIVTLFLAPAWLALVNGERELKPCTDQFGNEAFCNSPTSTTLTMFFGLAAIGYICGILYHVLMVASSGQTLGRKLFGIRVVDAGTGRPPSLGKSVGRYFMSLVSGWFCNLGYFWALWDSEKRTWHDMVCDTRVVAAGP